MKNVKKLFICLMILFGAVSFVNAQNSSFQTNNAKINQLLRAINEMYVDTVDFNKLVETGVVEMLKELDPHSVYIAPKDVQKANEPLQGGFDGIGVSYQLIKDTITVMEVIIDGPSEKVGLMPGDKIVKVDTSIACGKHISNSWVQSHLRGKKGTKVHIFVKRGRNPELLDFTITRDKIPQNSINVYYMVNNNTGYIRLERFAQNSHNEFVEAVTKLKARGMKNLIFDLRGNGGGYLGTAFDIADEFISKDRVIVYTENVRGNRKNYFATDNGIFEKGKLIVLVDESSASASEIVSGAVQDWDRGLVVGRRTFGKGLVQRPLTLADKSEVRLTIDRYYTPSGRCIQKPYENGLESYYNELNNRSRHGELFSADSIQFPDSLKYSTPNGRIVYGGGGIMPDIFIPLDTTRYSTLYNEMIRKGIISGFTFKYMETHRKDLLSRYTSIDVFKSDFIVDDDLINQVMEYAKNEGIKDSVPLLFSSRVEAFLKDANNAKKLDSIYNNVDKLQDYEEFEVLMTKFISDSYADAMKYRNIGKIKEYLVEAIRFEFARNLYSYGEAYQIILLGDDCFQQTIEIMDNDKIFKNFKVDK